MTTGIKQVPEQAVILAGGESSRFVPFQRNRHKTTFLLFGEPIIVQTLRALKSVGVKKVEIVRSPNDEVIKEVVGAAKLSLKVNFHTQKEPLGTGDALLTAKGVLEERFLMVSGQQVNVADHLNLLSGKENGVVLFSQKTDEPQKYGMLALNGNRVTRAVEKPKDARGLSDQRIMGIYVFTRDFIDFMATFKITDYLLVEALDAYTKENEVVAVETPYPAISLKYAWDLFKVLDYRFSLLPSKPQIKKGAKVAKSAVLKGTVVVENGAVVEDYAVVEGPCYIGKKTIVGTFCKVRPGTVLEEDVVLQNAVEIKHSIVGKGTHLHSGYLGDSIVGEDVRIGAGFISGNRRLDRGNIRVMVKGELVDTKSTFFGTLIGDRARIGIHCGTNPGVIILPETHILPGTVVSYK